MRLSSSSSTPSSSDDDMQEVRVLEGEDDSVKSVEGFNKKRLLSKQLSMRETSREAKWEMRRQQILNRQRRVVKVAEGAREEEHAEIGNDEEENRGRVRSLTDEDLDELRGSIELGFGFEEENGGHNLCDTLPALDLYFAVNRQFSDPKLRSPPSPFETPLGSPSPRIPDEPEQIIQQNSNGTDSWKICNPGESPQLVKMKIRHWAQVVACSVVTLRIKKENKWEEGGIIYC